MKFWKKISIFVILSLVLCMAFSTVAFATEAETAAVTESVTESGSETEGNGKLDMNEKPEAFSQRSVELALQGTITGMVMVFAVLGLLAIIVSLSKYVFNRDQGEKKSENTVETPASAPAPVVSAPVETPAPVAAAESTDDGELAAVITAAIAAMIESGDYKNEFVGGFRVVSFKRSTSGAWNRK